MKKRKRMVRIVNATEAKNKFGEMIKHAYDADEHLIVQKSGIPVVAIIPMSDYQRLFESEGESAAVAQMVTSASRREVARREVKKFLASVHAKMPDVSEAEADRDIDQAIREVRSGR